MAFQVDDLTCKKREPIPEVGFAATERRWQEAKKAQESKK